MPEDESKSESKTEKGSLLDKLKKQPKWIWIIAALGGGALIIVYERMHGSSSTSSTSGSSTNGVDQSNTSDGFPYYYDSTGNDGSLGSSGSSGYTPTPTPVPQPGSNPGIPTPSVPSNPIPNPTPSSGSSSGTPGIDYPLIPYGQLPPGTNYSLGSHLTWNNQVYTIGPGSQGILWGVPGNISVQQWQQTPISPSGKIKLYGPQSMYPPMGNGSGGASGFNEGWNTAIGHNDASLFAHAITNGWLEELQ